MSLGATISCDESQGETTTANAGRMTKGADPSRITVWVIPPREEAAKVLAKGGGNTEWVVERNNYEYQLGPHDQLQKR